MLSSCSSKLGELKSEYFTVVPNPMETSAGQVPVTINGMFPEKYMKKKAVVSVIPELRFAGQTAQSGPATFQGEKVMGNDQTISYKVGGNYSMKANFKYVPDMQKSDLYLTFDAKIGNRTVQIPAVKVADGIIATSELYKKTVADADAYGIALGSGSADAYQRIIAQKQEANIKFLIQQANLRKSELQNNSVKEFVNMLQTINNDREKYNVSNVEVSSYASPDGGVKLNDRLAAQRKNNTQKYVGQTMKKIKFDAPVDAKYTAQDWDGFQQLVAASNLQDKDVIIRVLSMYQDPQERESQIRNMSAAFSELADGILPELRRSRLTVNYEIIGRSDDQIRQQYKDDAKQLSIEETLYAATLTDNANEKAGIYKTAAANYSNDPRAYANLAGLAFNAANYDDAKKYANKALAIDANNASANAILGLVALQAGDVNAAETYISKASTNSGVAEVLGNLKLAQSKYAEAEKNFAGINTNSAALAQLLNKNYAGALNTLNNAKVKTAMTDYLKAIVNARQGNTSDAATALRNAVAKDSKLAGYAANDLELAGVSK